MSRQNREQRRAQLLETALRLFSDQGFDGTSTRSIAEAAGVTEALVFHYFPTKLALFHAVIVRYGLKSFEENKLEIEQDAPLAEVLAAQFDLLLNAIWKNRAAFQMLVGAALNNEIANDDLQIINSRMTIQLEKLLTDYETAGTIKLGMAIPAADILSFALRGFIVVSVRSDPEDWEAIRSSFVGNLIAVILPCLAV